MQNLTHTNLSRIIAKIDNDFNPDNSDWIPRVGAWCLDAMGMIDAIPTERKRIKLTVKDRIAYSECTIAGKNIKVYDENGCEVEEAKDGCGCGNPFTGDNCGSVMTDTTDGSSTTEASKGISIYKSNQPIAKAPDYLVAETILIDKSWPGRYRINEYNYGQRNEKRNYVLIGNDKIELNFDAKYICVEYDAIKTVKDENGCDVIMIPNNSLLIEAIVYFCMYKMLCRGFKHPVFNLAASQYGTNPYYEWLKLKEEARRSVLNDQVNTDEEISKLFRSNMYIESYDPRR